MPTFGGIVVSTGSQSTGRRIFLDVINELARPVDASDTTIKAHAADAFRSAVRTMNRKGNWPWEVLEEDISITSGQKFASVSGAIKKPLAMHYLNSSGGVRDQAMSYVPYDIFLQRYSMDAQSQALMYTIPNMFETGQIRFFPTPSADDNARLTYYRVTPAPRNEQETLEIPDYISEAYMSLAWYEFLKRIPSEQRPFSIAIAKGDARDAFREISSYVNSPGDRSRRVNVGGYGP